MIREVEPPTPSNRISTSDALPNVAANRQIEPTRMSRFVRGDLDWIVMKALAKDRQRRYDSAIGLADDIGRFTNHEPVPPARRQRPIGPEVPAEESGPGDPRLVLLGWWSASSARPGA